MAFSLALLFIGIAEGTGKEESHDLILREMAALDRAFKVTIDAVVLNEPGRIPPAFEEVDKIREEVEHAVKNRAKIVLPRNQKRFREFVRLDNKFHHELEILIKAAKKGRTVTVRRQTHRLLDACVRCHTIFRR